MTKQYRIMFMVPALYGHLAPSLVIANHLIEKGHKIAYCSGNPAKDILAKTNITDFYPRDQYHTALMETTLGKGPHKYWQKFHKIFTSDVIKTCFHELIAAVESFQPDILYVDTYDSLAGVVATNYEIPYAHGSATVVIFLEKGIPPIGTGWDINTPWRNRLKMIPFYGAVAPFMLKAYLNLKKAAKSTNPAWRIDLSGVSPYLYLLFSTDKIEYPRNLFIPQVFYVGPSILEPDENQQPDFPWDKLDKNRPLIYIATGTIFTEQYIEFYRNVLIALSEDNFPVPVQVVMAVGKGQSIEKYGNIPSNFIVVPYAPQIKLLQKAEVFITHGGVNSVNESLALGKPTIVVHTGSDRVDMGRRIEYRKAGICFHVSKASIDNIKKSVTQLLKDPIYKTAAKKIMRSYEKCNGGKTAADLILRLAETRKPIMRKKGAPITLYKIEDLPDYIEK